MKTKVMAHRGASAYAPENSLESFSKAIEMGADGIELDIYETADGRLVIHHDNNIKRMTGIDAKISETDFDVLRTYNFAGEYGNKYEFVKIPEFVEILDLFKKTDLSTISAPSTRWYANTRWRSRLSTLPSTTSSFSALWR